MTYQWVDYDPSFVSQRYDRLADFIALFDWLVVPSPGAAQARCRSLEP